MRRLVALPILAFCLALAASRAEAVTYTWVAGASGSWTTSTSWSPVRTSAAITDVMVFNSGAAITVLNVPNTSIAQIAVTNGSQVVFRPGGSNFVVTLNGAAGTDLVIGPNAMLSLESTGALVIQLVTGATGQIDGLYRANQAMHRLQAVDTGAIVFTSGSSALANSGNHPFGIGSVNSGPGSVVFQAGSTYIQGAALSPFGTAPQQVAVFQPGSWYQITQPNVNIAAGGRTFANVDYRANGWAQMTGTANCSMDSLVVRQGTFEINVNAEVTIQRGIRAEPASVLRLGPLTGPSTIHLAGTEPHVLRGATTTFGPTAGLIIDNPAGVSWTGSGPNFVNIYGDLEFRRGVFTLRDNDGFIAYLHVFGRVSGGSQATGWVDGILTANFAPSWPRHQLPFGTATEYTGVDYVFHGLSDTLEVYVIQAYPGPYFWQDPYWHFTTAQLDSTKKLNIQYHCNIPDTTVSWTSFDATLHFQPTNLDPGANPLNFTARARSGGIYRPNDPFLWTAYPGVVASADSIVLPNLTRSHPGVNFFGFSVGEPTVVNVAVQPAFIEEGGNAAKTPGFGETLGERMTPVEDLRAGAPLYTAALEPGDGDVGVQVRAPLSRIAPPSNVTSASSGSGSTLSFRVVLSTPSIETVTVDYATNAGSAAEGDDFTPESGTLTFLPGDTVQVVNVPLVGEGDAEGNETFSLVLSNVTGGATITQGEATGTILDDDDVEAPTVTVLAPNGGETVIEGAQVELQWSASDNVDVVGVDLEISRDGGFNWVTVASDLPNTGSYTWTATPELTQQALLRVTASDHRDQAGSDESDAVWSIWTADGVEDGLVPRVFALDLVSSNPSRSGARLRLAMPREQAVFAGVYDVRGRKVATLADGVLPTGVHDLTWAGDGAGAGLYFVDLVTDGYRARTRVIRLP